MRKTSDRVTRATSFLTEVISTFLWVDSTGEIDFELDDDLVDDLLELCQSYVEDED